MTVEQHPVHKGPALSDRVETIPEEVAQRLKEELAGIEEYYWKPEIDTYTEGKLSAAGLLSWLEDQGILPRLDPAPTGEQIDVAPTLYDWRVEDLTLTEAQEQAIEHRSQVLRILFAGLGLGYRLGDLIFPNSAPPPYRQPTPQHSST